MVTALTEGEMAELRLGARDVINCYLQKGSLTPEERRKSENHVLGLLVSSREEELLRESTNH